MRLIILAVEAVMAVPILYLAVIASGAIIGTKRRARRASSDVAPGVAVSELPTFAILVPAHNEERLLGGLLESLASLAYPKPRYAVHVVADNCTDTTAAVARQPGWVSVHERFDDRRRGKGYALAWLLDRLGGEGLVYDAYVILDADSIVSAGFLTVMARELGRGAHALQARYTLLNPIASPATVLRWIAFALMGDVRQHGRNLLGGSSSLLGNGMCFSRALLLRHPWRAFALSEDYQYYLQLVEHGERVRYVADAVVSTHMPTRFADLRSQDIRWESTIPERPSWKIALALVRAGVRDRDWVRFDAVLELLTPPLSLLVLGCGLVLIASLFASSPQSFVIGALLSVALGVYVGSAFYLLRPPASAYAALLYAPRFMAWKVFVFLILKRRAAHSTTWVRTARPDSATPEGNSIR
jgi:glycosyltransferase involved in cell wall biosynthesis